MSNHMCPSQECQATHREQGIELMADYLSRDYVWVQGVSDRGELITVDEKHDAWAMI